ncbi:MAG: hypothetical protein H6702_15495 [Myxococcales bacterium]|nr:hypothetical protein [Myxococcales bacterium]
MRLRTLALLTIAAAPVATLVAAPAPAVAKKKGGLKKTWKKVKRGAKDTLGLEKVGFEIHNCARRKATVCVYNADDKARVINRERKELIAGKSWKTHCMDWTPAGRGVCRVFVTEADMLCPVDVGNDVERVGQNQNLYIGVKAEAGKSYSEASPAPLWGRRGETDHCETRP